MGRDGWRAKKASKALKRSFRALACPLAGDARALYAASERGGEDRARADIIDSECRNKDYRISFYISLLVVLLNRILKGSKVSCMQKPRLLF